MIIGDRVKLISVLYIYPTYKEFFEKLNFKNLKENDLSLDKLKYYKNIDFTIINIVENPEDSELMYHITDPITNKELLVTKDSISKI